MAILASIYRYFFPSLLQPAHFFGDIGVTEKFLKRFNPASATSLLRQGFLEQVIKTGKAEGEDLLTQLDEQKKQLYLKRFSSQTQYQQKRDDLLKKWSEDVNFERDKDMLKTDFLKGTTAQKLLDFDMSSFLLLESVHSAWLQEKANPFPNSSFLIDRFKSLFEKITEAQKFLNAQNGGAVAVSLPSLSSKNAQHISKKVESRANHFASLTDIIKKAEESLSNLSENEDGASLLRKIIEQFEQKLKSQNGATTDLQPNEGEGLARQIWHLIRNAMSDAVLNEVKSHLDARDTKALQSLDDQQIDSDDFKAEQKKRASAIKNRQANLSKTREWLNSKFDDAFDKVESELYYSQPGKEKIVQKSGTKNPIPRNHGFDGHDAISKSFSDLLAEFILHFQGNDNIIRGQNGSDSVGVNTVFSVMFPSVLENSMDHSLVNAFTGLNNKISDIKHFAELFGSDLQEGSSLVTRVKDACDTIISIPDALSFIDVHINNTTSDLRTNTIATSAELRNFSGKKRISDVLNSMRKISVAGSQESFHEQLERVDNSVSEYLKTFQTVAEHMNPNAQSSDQASIKTIARHYEGLNAVADNALESIDTLKQQSKFENAKKVYFPNPTDEGIKASDAFLLSRIKDKCDDLNALMKNGHIPRSYIAGEIMSESLLFHTYDLFTKTLISDYNEKADYMKKSSFSVNEVAQNMRQLIADSERAFLDCVAVLCGMKTLPNLGAYSRENSLPNLYSGTLRYALEAYDQLGSVLSANNIVVNTSSDIARRGYELSVALQMYNLRTQQEDIPLIGMIIKRMDDGWDQVDIDAINTLKHMPELQLKARISDILTSFKGPFNAEGNLTLNQKTLTQRRASWGSCFMNVFIDATHGLTKITDISAVHELAHKEKTSQTISEYTHDKLHAVGLELLEKQIKEVSDYFWGKSLSNHLGIDREKVAEMKDISVKTINAKTPASTEYLQEVLKSSSNCSKIEDMEKKSREILTNKFSNIGKEGQYGSQNAGGLFYIHNLLSSAADSMSPYVENCIRRFAPSETTSLASYEKYVLNDVNLSMEKALGHLMNKHRIFGRDARQEDNNSQATGFIAAAVESTDSQSTAGADLSDENPGAQSEPEGAEQGLGEGTDGDQAPATSSK